MPTSQKSVVNPFFSNIRQNMDLIGGVGEVPITLPQNIGSEGIATLPAWLKKVVCEEDGSKIVADRFLRLEEAERERMQEALNVSVVYDSPTSTAMKPHTLAGVEKGTKNRYNNIWPYDHARVKLLDYPQDECDYVNASHVSAQYAAKKYIASQAPLPTTFRVGFILRFYPICYTDLDLGLLEYGLGARCTSNCYVDGRGRRWPSQKS